MDRRQFLGSVILATACCAPVFRMVESATLAVTDGHTHPITHMSQPEGERKLYKIVNSLKTELEDGWLFIRNGEVEKWVDIGGWQKSDEVMSDNRVINLQLDELAKSDESSEVTYYHIHHLHSVLKNTQRRDPGRTHLEQYHLEVFGAPGPSDIVAHMNLEDNLNKYLKGNDLVRLNPSRLVSPVGVFSYASTEKVRGLHAEKGVDGIHHLYKRAINQGVYDKDIGSMLRILEDGGIKINYSRTRNLIQPITLRQR